MQDAGRPQEAVAGEAGLVNLYECGVVTARLHDSSGMCVYISSWHCRLSTFLSVATTPQVLSVPMLPGTMSHGISRFRLLFLVIISIRFVVLLPAFIPCNIALTGLAGLLIVIALIGCSSGRHTAGRVFISGESCGCLRLGCAEWRQ